MDNSDDNNAAVNKPLMIERLRGEAEDEAMARTLLDPCVRHGFGTLPFVSGIMGQSVQIPGPTEIVEQVKIFAEQAATGDLSGVSRMLAAQAVALDTIFSELARRTAVNLGKYPDAVGRYAGLALKAQTSSRATLEALAKLHQPREQVRHVHVNNGGQAIVADEINNYAEGAGNAEIVEQSHATGPIGEYSSMPSQDPEGERVPVTGSEGKETLPNARRHKPRRSQG